jgi:hypothetical protein
LVASALLCSGSALFAGAKGAAAAEKAGRLNNEAKEAFDRAIAYDKAGTYSKACVNYRNADALWTNAIYASLDIQLDPDYDQQAIRQSTAFLQKAADQAKKSANEVCGKIDGSVDTPQQPSAPTSVFSSSSSAPTPSENLRAAQSNFPSIVLPNIKELAPYIEKSRAERLAAPVEHVRLGAQCRDAWKAAYYANVNSAVSAIQVCNALSYWINDDQASTCVELRMEEKYAKEITTDDQAIKAQYAQNGLAEVRARIVKAAACEQKSGSYWSKYGLAVFNSLPSYRHVIDRDVAEQYNDACQNSDNLTSYVSYDNALLEIAHHACFSVRDVSDNPFIGRNRKGACSSLGYQREKLSTLMTERPGMAEASEAPKVMATIDRLTTELGCDQGTPEQLPKLALVFSGPAMALPTIAAPPKPAAQSGGTTRTPARLAPPRPRKRAKAR